jgi:hypothetical protein
MRTPDLIHPSTTPQRAVDSGPIHALACDVQSASRAKSHPHLHQLPGATSLYCNPVTPSRQFFRLIGN